ncbi:MAG: hypothetical protein JNK05_09050 [Myxococcales bacterium]|nr:hypothetical protein [Myxococcales bacterium]
MSSLGEGTAQSRRGLWLGAAGITAAAIACGLGFYGSKRTPPPRPPLDPPSVNVEAGPSRWHWPTRRAQNAETAALQSVEATSLELSRPSCLPGDKLYAPSADGNCYLRDQALLASVSQRRFAGAPRRYDNSDLAALLRPSRAASEPEVDNSFQRDAAARVRSGSYVDEREASWCSFALEGAPPRLQLRAQCALDRLDLYVGAPPRLERQQSCGMNNVESCSESCTDNSDCRPEPDSDDDCGCAQSRCVAGRCTACAPRRVCAEPTFTTRAAPWTFRVAINNEQAPFARALAARPGSFRTLLQFAVTAASRDVRPRSNGTIEYDSGYRLQIRPLALTAALCGAECRTATRAILPLFAAPQWRSSSMGVAIECARGVCDARRAPTTTTSVPF